MLAEKSESQERTTETITTAPERPTPRTSGQACLVHIYPSGPSMGQRYPLSEAPLVIGRGSDCDIIIDDHAVSRRHTRVGPGPDGYQAVDLGSTNGTFVNGSAAPCHDLRDGDYLRIGACIYRYLASGNIEVEYHEEIYRLAIIDALTEIHNKRYLLEFLERELARSARHQRPLAVTLFDIDHFKSINDRHGHLCGDEVLRELARCVKGVIRTEELFARYGGEEFALVLPESTLDQAAGVAERVRALVAQHPFRFDNAPLAVTVSLGVAATSGTEALTGSALLQQADKKLYEAKHAGRNRVVA